LPFDDFVAIPISSQVSHIPMLLEGAVIFSPVIPASF
jgi:hypothetical protein